MAGMMKKIFDMINPSEEYEDEEGLEQNVSVPNDESSDFSEPARRVKKKVLNIYKEKLSISCFKPNDYDSEVPSMADSLIAGRVIVLDLDIQNKNPDVSRRIIDFLRGTTHAIRGKFVKVARSTYVLTPHNVEINGTELINELEDNEIYV